MFSLCYNFYEVDMNKIRIAHLADFHLGAQLNGQKELNEKVNKALIKSLVNIFDVLNCRRFL